LIVNFPKRPPLNKSSIKEAIRMKDTLAFGHDKAKAFASVALLVSFALS
jgi:hypothetical protein